MRRRHQNIEEWHQFFCWQPYDIDYTWVWLERIWRRAKLITEWGPYWEYSLEDPTFSLDEVEPVKKGGCVIDLAEPSQEEHGRHYVYKTIESRRLQRATPPPAMTPEQELQHLELVALRKHVDPFDTSRERVDE